MLDDRTLSNALVNSEIQLYNVLSEKLEPVFQRLRNSHHLPYMLCWVSF